MSKLLNVSSSPHVESHETIHSIMLDVAIAMLPTTAFGMYHFDMHMLLVLIVAVAACVSSKYVYEKLMKRLSAISDCSALVMGLILALNTSPEIPVWVPVLDGVFATIVVRRPYGGLRQNFMNSALTVRRFPSISFAGKITGFGYSGFNGVSGAIPLAVFKSGKTVDVPAMFVGSIPDIVGEVSVIALLIGAACLLAKKVISIRIPDTYTLTVAVSTILFGSHGFDLNCISAHLYDGGPIFGAFFMTADYVASPITSEDQVVFDILLGVLTGLFRVFGGPAEGVSYTIIINNILVPLIEKVTPPKALGKEGK